MTAKINLNNMFNGLISVHWMPKCDPELEESQSVGISEIPDIKFATDCFVSMVGGIYDFHGILNDSVKLNDMIFQILEDPDDGYRSYLGAVRIPEEIESRGFYNKPIAKVRLETSDMQRYNKAIPQSFRGYILVDTEDGHIWALIGTGSFDDSYPYCVLDYNPKLKDKIKGR